MVRAAPEEGRGGSTCPARTSPAPPGRDRGGVTGQHVLIPIQLGRVEDAECLAVVRGGRE